MLAILVLLALPAHAAEERVLFIGDSHSVGSFGHDLDGLLRGWAPETATYASCGSSPFWWFDGQATPCGFFQRDLSGHATSGLKAPTPLLETLLADVKPTIIVVEQGANLVNSPLDFIASDSRRMADAIAKASPKCLWLGPPHTRLKTDVEQAEYNGVLRGAVSGACQYMDSRPFTHYPETGGDGTHYDQLGPPGVAMMQAWADAALAAVKALP